MTGPGEPTLSPEETAILLGIDVAMLRAEVKRQGGGPNIRLPKAWVQAGRRRAREYQAHTGRTDMKGAIEWWRGR